MSNLISAMDFSKHVLMEYLIYHDSYTRHVFQVASVSRSAFLGPISSRQS